MKICIICNEKLIFAFTENIKSLNIKKRTPIVFRPYNVP